MKETIKKLFATTAACCLLFSLSACGGETATPAKSESAQTTQAEAPALECYDYVAIVEGMTIDFTIAQNLKSFQGHIKSNGLDFSGFCTVEDGVFTPTEKADGNDRLWTGFAAHAYKLNADGTTEIVEK